MNTFNEINAPTLKNAVQKFLDKFADDEETKKELEQATGELFSVLQTHCLTVALASQGDKTKEFFKDLIPKSTKKSVPKEKKGKFCSIKALELAKLHNISEDDIKGTGAKGRIKISDIKKLIPDKKPEKTQCNGLTKKGKPCSLNGLTKPEGGEHHYCYRHIDDWEIFESDETSVTSEIDESKIVQPEILNDTVE